MEASGKKGEIFKFEPKTATERQRAFGVQLDTLASTINLVLSGQGAKIPSAEEREVLEQSKIHLTRIRSATFALQHLGTGDEDGLKTFITKTVFSLSDYLTVEQRKSLDQMGPRKDS